MNNVELDGLSWPEILRTVDQALEQLLRERPRKASDSQLVLDLGSRLDASVIGAALAVHVNAGHVNAGHVNAGHVNAGVALAISLSSFSGSPVLLVAQQLDVLKQLWGNSLILRNDADTFGEEVLAALKA